MRIYTILLSLLAHALAVAAAFVVPIAATTTLPVPRRITVFVGVRPVAPPEPQRPAEIAPRPRTSSPEVAPIEEPQGVRPETAAPPPDLFAGQNSIVTGIVQGDADAIPEPLPPPPPPPPPVGPVRVGGAIRPPQKIVHVAPEYPAIARASRTSGVVILEAVIAEDGRVRDVRILRSVPLLDDAAMRAVMQWQFTPTLLNGQAVPVVMTVTIAFALN